ncbi:hypothetical protein [Rothia nasimurium]|nr:hypothetical protein [Rothia nasimurium]
MTPLANALTILTPTLFITTGTAWLTIYIAPNINHPTLNRLTTWLGYK